MSNELVRLEDILEEDWEASLRPTSLDDFTGQEQLISRLRIRVEAAKRKGASLPHMLFTGPAGLGKTSLASLMASELGVNMQETSGEALTNSGDIYAILKSMEDGDVLFIDEIHRLNKATAEALYPAMEDFKVPLVLGRGPSAKLEIKEVPRFTLVAATTEAGKIKKPLRERFGFVGRLAYYTPEELKEIVVRSAAVKELSIDEQAAEMVALRSRGTPRKANMWLSGLADFALVYGEEEHISAPVAEGFFESEGIDPLGLEEREREYLHILCERFEGAFVGVKNIGAVMGESEDSLTEIEEWLIHEQLVVKSNQGRAATRKAYLHLNLRLPYQPRGMVLEETLV